MQWKIYPAHDDTAVQLIQQVMIDRLVAICHRFGLHLRLQFPMLHPCLHKLDFFFLKKYISKCRVARVVDNIDHRSIIDFFLKKSILCQEVDNLVDILSTIAERR